MPWPRGYKTFFMLNLNEHEIILLINVKMPTCVGILTFIGRINTLSESFKARTIFTFQHFSFSEHIKLHALADQNFAGYTDDFDGFIMQWFICQFYTKR